MFQLLGKKDIPLVRYKEIACHLFSVKIDIARKSYYASYGHLTNPLFSMTYASIVI